MKVSSQVLIALLAGLVAANERGRQNDWHKAHKPEKFKPNAPRNEGKVLREDRKAERESDEPVVRILSNFVSLKNLKRLKLKKCHRLTNLKRLRNLKKSKKKRLMVMVPQLQRLLRQRHPWIYQMTIQNRIPIPAAPNLCL